MGLLDWLFGKPKKSPLRSALPDTIALPQSGTWSIPAETPNERLSVNTLRLPLIASLKHLHIAYNGDTSDSLAEFSRSARLMQGDREIPPATDAQVSHFLNEPAAGSLPEGHELKFLTMACHGWPEDATFGFAGITAFGASDLDRARTCARKSFTVNRDCKLAKQLVNLLLAKTDLKCQFGVDAAHAPDVPAILAGNVETAPKTANWRRQSPSSPVDPLREESVLPSSEEFYTVPRWVLIMYGVRCMRRVHPLFDATCGLDRRGKRTFSEFMDSIEWIASRGDTSDTAAARILDVVARSKAVQFAGRRITALTPASLIQRGIATLAGATRRAFEVSIPDTYYVHQGIQYFSRAVSRYSEALTIEKEFRRDFDILIASIARDQLSDDDTIDLQLFGVMWPEGTPQPWPS